VGLSADLDILIEGDEEAQKALDGELAEVAAQHLGDIGGDQNPKRLALVESHFSQRTREMGHPAKNAASNNVKIPTLREERARVGHPL